MPTAATYTAAEKARLSRVADEAIPTYALFGPGTSEDAPYYREVPRAEALQEGRRIVEVAEATVRLCAAELGLTAPPLVTWYVQVTPWEAGALVEAGGLRRLHRRPRTVRGFAGARNAGLMLGGDPVQAAHTAAHEVRHVWQYETEVIESMDYEAREADAKAYAIAALSRFADVIPQLILYERAHPRTLDATGRACARGRFIALATERGVARGEAIAIGKSLEQAGDLGETIERLERFRYTPAVRQFATIFGTPPGACPLTATRTRA